MFSHSRLLDQLIKTDDEFTERASERGAKQSERDAVTSLRARNTRLRGGRIQSCFDKKNDSSGTGRFPLGAILK